MGIAAIPAELKSTSSLKDRKRQGAASKLWLLPSRASQFSVPENYSALFWDMETKRTLPAVSRDDVHPSVCPHRCIPPEWMLAGHPGVAAGSQWFSSSIPSQQSPGGEHAGDTEPLCSHSQRGACGLCSAPAGLRLTGSSEEEPEDAK